MAALYKCVGFTTPLYSIMISLYSIGGRTIYPTAGLSSCFRTIFVVRRQSLVASSYRTFIKVQMYSLLWSSFVNLNNILSLNCIPCSIVHTLVSRDWRARTLIHDVPVEDIIGVLSQYGISKDILPTETGGLLQSHQREWIAHRRAIEMEEL